MISWLRGFWLRLRYYVLRARYDCEMEEEMRFHVELRAAEHQHAGMTEEEARAAATRRFGNRTSLQESRRSAVGFPTLDTLGQDVRYVLRAIRHSPGFSVMVVLTLGLAIGANAAMFGIIDRLLLRGPAFVVDPDRVVRVYITEKDGNFGESTGSVVGFVTYDHLRATAHDFEDLAVLLANRGDCRARHGCPADSAGPRSWNFFPMLGVRPVVGSLLWRDEDRLPQGENVVVLDEGYWKRSFAGDRGVIGRPLVMGGVTYTIVGVAPRGFTGVEFEDVATRGCRSA